MHLVTDSAISARRGDRREAIVVAAQELAIAHGLSGFTLDDLAERVGVSRRTLFNHVESKEAAVLGTIPVLDDAHAEALRRPGDGPLLDDVLQVLCEVIVADDETVAGWQRLHDVVEANLELLPRIKGHMQNLAVQAATHLTTRPGVDLPTAHTAIAVCAAVMELAMRDCLSDPGIGTLAERCQTHLTTVRRLASQV